MYCRRPALPVAYTRYLWSFMNDVPHIDKLSPSGSETTFPVVDTAGLTLSFVDAFMQNINWER